MAPSRRGKPREEEKIVDSKVLTKTGIPENLLKEENEMRNSTIVGTASTETSILNSVTINTHNRKDYMSQLPCSIVYNLSLLLGPVETECRRLRQLCQRFQREMKKRERFDIKGGANKDKLPLNYADLRQAKSNVTKDNTAKISEKQENKTVKKETKYISKRNDSSNEKGICNYKHSSCDEIDLCTAITSEDKTFKKEIVSTSKGSEHQVQQNESINGNDSNEEDTVCEFNRQDCSDSSHDETEQCTANMSEEEKLEDKTSKNEIESKGSEHQEQQNESSNGNSSNEEDTVCESSDNGHKDYRDSSHDETEQCTSRGPKKRRRGYKKHQRPERRTKAKGSSAVTFKDSEDGACTNFADSGVQQNELLPSKRIVRIKNKRGLESVVCCSPSTTSNSSDEQT